jgi:hypothetical protein
MAVDYKELIGKFPVLGPSITWMSSNDIDYGGTMFAGCVMLLLALWYLSDISFAQIFIITAILSPLWLTFFVFRHLFYPKWMDYVGKSFALYNGRTTLRIKLPPEVKKSPEAMEFVISQIHNTASPDNLMQTYLQGKRPLTFSFEIVSIGGDVRFYVNVPTSKTKAAFEANMYAQYPGVEIIEEPVDYAAEIPIGGGEDYGLMSFHMRKKKDQEFPIKTYIDFGLDKMPDEDEKVDPMTPMLEVLGACRPKERVYVQIIAKPFRRPSFKGGEQLTPGEGPDWVDKVKEKINEMMNRDPDTKAAIGGGGAEELARLTSGERNTIEAMERNMDKYAYKVGIRWMYVHPNEEFNGDYINPMIRVFSQYDIIQRNAIGVAWRTDTHYKDFVPGDVKKIAGWKKQEHKEFKTRVFYNKNSAGDMKIFTAEELATLFHLPGKVALTPSLDRVDSTRSAAPANLPIGTMPS